MDITKKPDPPGDETATSADMNRLRRIPAVERVLSSGPSVALIEQYGREPVKRAVVETLARARGNSQGSPESVEEIVREAATTLNKRLRPSIRPVINATGVIVHTNLGRSPVDESLLLRSATTISHYSNLEYDLGEGARGSRDEHLSLLATELFGSEEAILTNNNAAATLLVMAAIAGGRDVIVSRGELVEIGGSFRVPEVIEQGGARLREVGTTNRTRASDYSSAVQESTAALLRVNRSNFEIIGFTESPSVEDLVAVARGAGVPFIFDEGSGRVVDLSRYGFASKPTVRELLAAGVDLVTCSTDKLIGATQGGMILGKRELVDRCRRHPLMRALRAGKETYAVIGETLRSFLTGRQELEIPIYRMLATTIEELRERARRIADESGWQVCETASALGGGTTPGEAISSIGLTVSGSPDRLVRRLREFRVPIIGRVHNAQVTLDLRTVLPDEDDLLVEALGAGRLHL
ncbi:MAG: L-seryl-tRNA(Sec) selenium transferase [Acidobacteriota bacterium]